MEANTTTSVKPKEGHHHVLRKTWECWSPGTPLQIIEFTDGLCEGEYCSALVRINRTVVNEVRDSQTSRKRVYVDRRSEQVVIPLEYITERRRG